MPARQVVGLVGASLVIAVLSIYIFPVVIPDVLRGWRGGELKEITKEGINDYIFASISFLAGIILIALSVYFWEDMKGWSRKLWARITTTIIAAAIIKIINKPKVNCSRSASSSLKRKRQGSHH